MAINKVGLTYKIKTLSLCECYFYKRKRPIGLSVFYISSVLF